jgi:hypothetical protein
MSQAGIGTAIDKLLHDEDLRDRFASDRIGAVAELCSRGAELTRDDIEVLCRADPRLWSVATGWAENGAPDAARHGRRAGV